MHIRTQQCMYYCIAGNFGKVFNLAIGEFGIDRQIKYSPIELNACTPMAVSIQIAKFKLRQYLMESQFAEFKACQSYPLYGI